MRWASFLLVLALIALAAPRPAEAWWNDGWSFRTKITLDLPSSGVAPGAEAPQVPILIRLHVGNFAFDDTQENGADLRIVAADDKTPLPFYVEKYDWANQVAYIWVTLPKLAATTPPPYFWLYYGNATAPAVSDAKSVWDPAQTLAFHFALGETLPHDATAFANNATQSTATLVANGQIDVGAHYDGTAATLVPASPSLKLAAKGGFTFTAWVNSEAAQDAILFQQQDGSRSLTIALDNGKPVIRLVGDDGQTLATPETATLAPNEWHQLAATAGPDGLALFIDGAKIATAAATLPELAGAISLGGPVTTGSANTPVTVGGFKGLLDEVRLANAPRGPDWLKFETLEERPDAALLVLGEEEQAKAGSDYLATIGVLAGAVSLDGWFVIALIGLLGFVSGEVAIGKALMLRRAVRANAQFLDGFRGQGGDPLALAGADPASAEKGARWKDSPLYAIYSAGAAEFGRLKEAQSETERFTTLSLEAVRATVDTRLVTEANRINDKMVMLTLAVSGAPFLGLLGTVVGIMITFATIALKGDVNINTIAPGIAAALTATAAGMLVAIPALITYNVLATRIRAITMVMETFRDELLSKIAARYS